MPGASDIYFNPLMTRKGDTPLFRRRAVSGELCKKKGSVPFSSSLFQRGGPVEEELDLAVRRFGRIADQEALAIRGHIPARSQA